MSLKHHILLSGLALILVVSARANPSFDLTPAMQSGTGSNEIYFTGTFTNTNATDNLFLNGIQIIFDNTATNYLTADTNVFYANVPGILLPGETYTDVVFGIAINSTIPRGDYTGTVTLQGGTNIFAADNLTNQTFQISLPPAAMGAAISGANLVLTWPTPPGGFVLQQNSDLTTTNWITATNTPTVTNSQNQIILPPPTYNLFYRLKYP